MGLALPRSIQTTRSRDHAAARHRANTVHSASSLAPCAAVASSEAASCPCNSCSLSRINSPWRTSSSPAAVICSPRWSRTNKRRPNASSSALSLSLAADTEQCARREAAESEPVSEHSTASLSETRSILARLNCMPRHVGFEGARPAHAHRERSWLMDALGCSARIKGAACAFEVIGCAPASQA